MIDFAFAGLAIVATIVVVILNRNRGKKERRPKTIRFSGNDTDRSRFNRAIDLLKSAPDLYEIVLNLREVRAVPHPKTGISGVDRERRIFYWVMGAPASTAYDASTLIHDAYHIIQWRKNRDQPAGEREREAQDLQIRVAKRLGAMQSEIDYLRNCRFIEGRWIC